MPDLIPLITNPERATVTELTAAGRGAICVLAVSGLEVPGKLQTFFRAANRKPLADQSTMKPIYGCLLYTSPSPRDRQKSRMPSSA